MATICVRSKLKWCSIWESINIIIATISAFNRKFINAQWSFRSAALEKVIFQKFRFRTWYVNANNSTSILFKVNIFICRCITNDTLIYTCTMKTWKCLMGCVDALCRSTSWCTRTHYQQYENEVPRNIPIIYEPNMHKSVWISAKLKCVYVEGRISFSTLKWRTYR